MQHRLSEKERERERVGGRDLKKKGRERDGRGGRKRERPREHNTTDDFEEQMIPLSCLLGFFFSFQNFSIGITWNLKKNNLRFSVDKNFQ